MNFFETFPESSLLSTVSKNTIKMIGHHSPLRDMMRTLVTQKSCAVRMRNAILRNHLKPCKFLELKVVEKHVCGC